MINVEHTIDSHHKHVPRWPRPGHSLNTAGHASDSHREYDPTSPQPGLRILSDGNAMDNVCANVSSWAATMAELCSQVEVMACDYTALQAMHLADL